MKLIPTLILTFLTCIFSFGQDFDYAVSSIPEALKKNANAVVRLNDFNVQIEAKNSMTTTVTRIVTILNERGNAASLAAVGYDDYIKVKKVEARIFDASGNELKKIRKKDFIQTINISEVSVAT